MNRILLSFFSLLSLVGFAQKPMPSVVMTETNEKIEIDGDMNEEVWASLPVAKDFFINTPVDSAYAKSKTEVRICYDRKNIYIFATCYNSGKGPYVIESLKRDFSYSNSDAFSIVIDPYDDHTNGFNFGINPYGAQLEGLIQNGGTFGGSISWDNVWYSKVKRHSDRWVAEIAIPFTSIRYNEGANLWRVNFTRNDVKTNESSSWSAVPRNFGINTLTYCGNLNWDKPIKKSVRNVAIIPYVTANSSKDYENNTEVKLGYNTGADAKIGVSSSLQLDLTINPDFSQVEVDRQVTNLSRFSLFFPERRNFFLENSDLFANFGFRQIRPFFSRKVGLDNGNIIPILAGARLSGKIGKDWRIGVMNIQTEGQLGTSPQNYTVAALQRKVLKNSNLGLILMNQQGFNDRKIDFGNFNRIIGVDFNFLSPKNDWIGKVFSHHSFSPNQQKNSLANASFLRYSTQTFRFMWNHEYVGENYTANVGFVPRQRRYNPDLVIFQKQTFWRIEPEVGYRFYSKKENSKLVYHGSSLYLNQYLDNSFKNTDFFLAYTHSFIFQNTSEISVSIRENFTKLFFDTDVSFAGNDLLEKGGYNYTNSRIQIQSNQRKKIVATASSILGEYYNGTRLNYGFSISYRLQPYGKLSLSFNQNHFYLPHLSESVDLTLIGAETEFSFTKSIFFTTFFQYNTQVKNFNINSRFQWRFKPMSDLFLVYSENYLTDNLSIRNRSLVVKFVYWFQ